jgi:hypothetical protein
MRYSPYKFKAVTNIQELMINSVSGVFHKRDLAFGTSLQSLELAR